ncbi:MAG: DsbA family oxidoreductase [Alphaproteobacteria bacterium]|nr:DsbA family oxidoreductase [Alphaproteobacteria bacterium]
MHELRVDVFDDPACPWCLVGLRRLDNAIAALGDRAVVEVVHHPFLLDPSASPEGEDVVEMLTRKYGRPPFDAWDRLEQEAKSAGLDLDMRKQKLRHWSQPALALIAAADIKGIQHELAVALGRANYLEARNIADPEVLVDIATRFGFSPEEARAVAGSAEIHEQIAIAAREATQQGIGGVPFFIIAGRFAFSGAQPQDVFDQAFEAALAEAA